MTWGRSCHLCEMGFEWNQDHRISVRTNEIRHGLDTECMRESISGSEADNGLASMILVLLKRKEVKYLQVTRHQQGAFEIMVMQVVTTTTWYHGLWHQGAYQWSSTERGCWEVTASAQPSCPWCRHSIDSTLFGS